MKDVATQVSEEMGLGGELTDEVLAEARRRIDLDDLLADWSNAARAEYVRRYGDGNPDLAAAASRTSIKVGKKYINLDIDGSGAFMLDKATGEIFCIKGYGKIDRRKRVGVLGQVTGEELVGKRFWRLK